MEEQVISKKAKTEHSLNIKELFFKYIRFLPLYIISIALALVGAFMYLRYSTEIYRSSGTIIIRDDKSAPSMSDRIEDAMQSNNRKNIQTEIEVLQSRPLMERAVDALKLNFNYYSKGKIKELDIYKISPYRIEALQLNDSMQGFTLDLNFRNDGSFIVSGSPVLNFGQVFENQYGKFRLVKTNKGALTPEGKIEYKSTPVRAASLQAGLVVVPKQNTGILTLLMESTSPHLAADVINALMAEYQNATIEEKNAATRKSLEFIDGELKKRAADIDSITQVLVAYQKGNNIIEPQTQANNYLTRVEDAHQLIQQQRIQLNNALQLQDYVQGNTQDLVPSSLGIEDPVLNTLVTSYNKSQLEKKELLENAQPGHVIVQQKNIEIEALRGKILENVKNIKSAYGKTLSMFQSSSGEAISQLKTLPTQRQELLDIQNKLESKLKLYNEFLLKRDISAITLASTISNTKVMQEAMPDSTPVKPNRRSTQILAFFIGILIPTIIIVLLELFNDKVNSRHDVERLTNATILGEVGHSVSDKTLIINPGNRKVIAEQFRILRSNLQYILTKAPKPVIMVTSSFSGEGKSFISINIGAVMALANKKTIVLEFDIRKPKIMSGMGLTKSRGLTNFILGEVAASDLPIPVPGFDNLYALPCGPLPPNPGELLLDSKLDELFTYLRQNFDVVIMDTAPVGMVSDAMTLSKYADCTLYIVRQKHTYKKQIALVDAYDRENKLPKISIVLNDVKMQAGYGAYGYGGSYGYGYGSGYFEDEPHNQSQFDKWLGWLSGKNGQVKKQKRNKV
jgi:tyrosine-protein kinase Etk/Wzc